MNDAAKHEAAERDVDFGFEVEALPIMSGEALSKGHPAEGTFDDLLPGQNSVAGLLVGSADNSQNEVAIGGSVQEAGAIVGVVGEQMLEPGLRLERLGMLAQISSESV